MKSKKVFGLIVAAVLAVSLFAAGCSGKGDSAESGSARAGKGQTESGQEDNGGTGGGNLQQREESGIRASLRSFEAAALDGSSFTQEDIAAKDVTLINFWALTCPPCIREMPEIAAFADSLPDNVQVVTVCLDGSTDE